MNNLEIKTFADGVPVHYRPGTSDERVLREVVEQRAYRRPKIGFDIEAGERWLDLGANIGSFAIYCRLRGASAICYEPEPECFQILQQNVPGFICHNAAVSALPGGQVPFWVGGDVLNHYRGTLMAKGRVKEAGTVLNVCAKSLVSEDYDGVKMDIEGSEGPLIDQWLLPRCRKLCFEYHTSRDNSIENLARRLAILKEHFVHVDHVPELGRLAARGHGTGKTFHDRVIYCKDPK